MRQMMGWLVILALGLAASAPAAAQDIKYFVDTGPLRVRDQFLLNMGFLAFDPASATVLAPGEWQLDAVLTATNTFAHSEAMVNFLEARQERLRLTREELRSYAGGEGEGIFQLDAEVYRTAFTVRRGIGHRLQLELLVPVLSFQGGFADGIIEDFHDTFGFGQSGRLGVPRDGYLVYVGSRKGELLVDRDPGTGLGDVVLGAKLDLKRKPGPLLLAFEGQVKLPTGDEDSLYSSGTADAGVQLLASRYFQRSCIHASAGLLYLGAWDALGTPDQLRASGMLAYEHGLGRKVSGILQATLSQSPFDDLDLEELSDVSYQVSAGLKVAAGERRMLFFALTENLVHFNNTADLGLHVGLSETF